MIGPKTVAEIRRLLAEEKHSYRKIAGMTGVSRGTVGAIASGKRCDNVGPRTPYDDMPEEPSGPPARCPGCGGQVYLPCLLCHLRKNPPKIVRPGPHPLPLSGHREVVGERGDVSGPPLSLDLKPEHHARYEEVRAWRRENQCQAFEE